MESALAASPVALWTSTTGPDPVVNYISPNFERVAGVEGNVLLGCPLTALRVDSGPASVRFDARARAALRGNGQVQWRLAATASHPALRFDVKLHRDARDDAVAGECLCGTVSLAADDGACTLAEAGGDTPDAAPDSGSGIAGDVARPARADPEVHNESTSTAGRGTDARLADSLVRRVLEACPVPISLTRPDGAVLYANAASKALFGTLPETRRGWAEEFYADPEDGREMLQRLNDDGCVDRLEVDVVGRDGRPLPASLSARLVEYGDEPVIVAVAEDLTERRRLRDETDRQREALAQGEKLSALGELLASVAHELNNPLSVVVGQALLLGETAGDERTRKRAELIGGAAERCSRIVRSFLSMAGAQPAAARRFDVCDSIRAAAEMTASSLRDSGVDVHLRLPDNLPLVDGDKDQLTQVLTNLILNARHALEEVDAPRYLKVTASARAPGGTVVVKVKDNGPGVAAEHRGRIFEPLYTTRPAGTGTGMGLALSHRIIEAHGGTIHLERSRRGATFSVRLPSARAADAVHAGQVETDCPAVGHLAVLIIDDEPDVADTLAEMVRADGHTVKVAHSGLQGLDVLREGRFDVVLTDVRMPGLDGPGLFDALGQREDPIRDRLVFITGDSLSPHVQRFLLHCGRPCMEKPVQPAEVRAVLRAVAGRPQ